MYASVNYATISLDNGLVSVWRQATIWTHTVLSLSLIDAMPNKCGFYLSQSTENIKQEKSIGNVVCKNAVLLSGPLWVKESSRT